jgi:hypothetical protein
MFAASKLHGPKPSYSKGGRPARGGETRGIVYDGRGDCEGLATTKVQKSRSSDRIDAFPASLRSPASAPRWLVIHSQQRHTDRKLCRRHNNRRIDEGRSAAEFTRRLGTEKQ